MGKNVSGKFGKGISPQQFIDGMTRNQETFVAGCNAFQWPGEADREFFESLNNRDDLRCILIMADWCGDVVKNVPVVFKALEISGMPTEVMIMEQHEDLIDQFLTMGGRSIPIVIFADTGGYVLGQWGPRPKHVQEVMIEFKQQHPDRSAPDYDEKMRAVRAEMGRRYGEGNAHHETIIRELRELLSTF